MSKMISLFSLIVALGFGTATAQVATQNVLVCDSGKVKKLKIKNLTGASVGNIFFAHIQALRGDEVSIYASALGETTLELTLGAGQKETLRLRVISKDMLRARVVANKTSQPLKVIAESRVEDSEKVVPAEEGPVPGAVPAATIQPKLVAIQREPKRPRLSISRLQISFEPFFLTDTERYPVVFVESDESHGTKRQAEQNPTTDVATVRRSVSVLPVSLRYDISSRNSLNLVIPIISRVDEIVLGKDKRKTVTRGLGDVQIGFDREFPRLGGSAWDGVLGLNAGLPTGRSIYDVDEAKSPLGLGHLEVGSQLAVRRLFDPFAVNAALGVYYTLPRMLNRANVSPGIGHSLQTGFSYALSDRWVISEQLIYSRRPNVFLNGPNDLKIYSSDQANLTHGLLFNPDDGSHVFRMSFSLGLTPTSSDRGFGISYIYQRKPVHRSLR